MLSGPPPCKVCGSRQHGHIVFDACNFACPDVVSIDEDLVEVVKRNEKGELIATLEVEHFRKVKAGSE
jgi:hypothetical protein